MIDVSPEGPSSDPVAVPDSNYAAFSVCVEDGVGLRVMTWWPKQPISDNPIIFVAGWVSAVTGWAPLLKVMAARRPFFLYINFHAGAAPAKDKNGF